MATLHGTWILNNQNSYFFIWGETWRSSQVQTEVSAEIPLHPLAMTSGELNEWLEASNLSIAHLIQPSNNTKQRIKSKSATEIKLPVHSQIISLPTYFLENKKSEPTTISPVHSVSVDIDSPSSQYLHPWQIDGFCLTPALAIQFLSSLPLSTNDSKSALLGADIHFWVHIYRWHLDLISRCKFLPTVEKQDSNLIAKWQVLLDSAVDVTRLEKFASQMPLACRTYQQTTENIAIDLPLIPQEIILSFLNNITDNQLRLMVGSQSPLEPRIMMSLPAALQQWLQGLINENNIIDAAGGERLETTLKAWTLPLQYQLTGKALFRTCFQLLPPENEDPNWTLKYFLQAADNLEFLIDAATIWHQSVEKLVYQNRTIAQPQETFLRGLGLASRLYPIITPSLETASPEFCHLTPMEAYEFIKAVTWKFEDSGLGVILPPSLANREGWANRLGLKISAETPQQKSGRLGLQSLLNFQWHLAIGGQTISKVQFDKLVKLNSPLVEINGEWVELRPQDIKTAQTFFSSRKEQMSLSLEDALRISKGDTQVIEKLPVVSFEASGALEELIGALTNNQEIQPLTTPKIFRGELRPYQERGAGWLAFLERWGLGACLADDMGLGKTVQFIAFLLHLKEENVLEKPTLLVCPTSVMGNWQKEVKKFAPTLKVLEYHGDKRPKGKAFTEAVNKHDIVITSYALIHRDIKLLKVIEWQIIVLDEAQNIKNSEAKQSQAVRQLETTFRIALTGTPVENRLQELWSILDFLNPGYLGNKQFFQRRFAMPIEKYGDTASLNQLRSLVQPFILRRLKSDKDIIQDLPDKQEMTVFCGLTSEQATLYQQLVDESLVAIESAEGLQRRGMILGLLVKLKQICNHPSQYLKLATLEKHHSAKLQRLEEMLDEVLVEEDRALIFTQFAEWGKLLKPYLEKKLGREIFFLYGSTSKKQREEMIDRFQHDPQGPPIMILSLKAGGVGLNLTRANHVFHFDRWWNPAVENQATDRVFRIGQTRNVQVHKFVCTGTLEEKINDMIESKKQLAEQVVGAGEDWLTEMDTDQLRNLLILDRNAVIEEDEV
ncbi:MULTISPECIES: DEAD/DEAH box helicase [unclassified Dolichospermum]|uniref:DEAD/DEAH box helicase n=1 Tax=unclassified Dolichospermum TaxID=2622029 RepID=UPI001444AB8F|nr:MULTISPECIES: DEAD/DEAH box helicase [unclassified Dolichospermum]MTJ16188.1 DEAD/DEAH box helicase [Dolichospermum sp. UHCC 0299]MTJ38236.1 DEAD/DEAH box helicase [Dolichospermum sp. UHCC 0406]